MRYGLISKRGGGVSGGMCGSGRWWADFDIGDRSEQTFLRLYERLPEAELYRTDAYRVYGWLPSDRHHVGKGGAVNWNEGLHSWYRGKLNRLHRRTKGYTKSVAMLSGSLALLLEDWPAKSYDSLC